MPDIAKEGAFDEVVKTPGLTAVLHTASPFHFNVSKYMKYPGVSASLSNSFSP